MQTSTEIDLKDVLTSREPLGPRATEDMLNHPDAFRELYASKAHLAERLIPRRPAYVVGRKGSGKTAFLIGEGLTSGSDVVSIKAEHAFTVMDELRKRWVDRRGALPVDSLVFLWEAVLTHAAMRGALLLPRRSDATRLSVIKRYLAAVAPAEPAVVNGVGAGGQGEDQFLAALGQALSDAIGADGGIAAVRDIVAGIGGDGLTYADARREFVEMLERPGREGRLCVVVDNLEDLHMRLDELSDVLAGLFRIVSRVTDPAQPIPLPFDLRFAFPAELTRDLRRITANPEKDFRNPLVVTWDASDLIELAGRRLRTSLEVNFGDLTDLDASIPPADQPEAVLRAVLPKDGFVNGLGGVEDPAGYLMRHTQLLPRHLIQILNEVTSPMFSGSHLRRVTAAELRDGVRTAERTIVEGILSSYLHEFPNLRVCLERLQNQLPFAFSERALRHAYTAAGVKRASGGERFEEFLWAAVTAGIIGLQRRSTKRYVIADFSYTFEGALRPLPGDELCLHPLFVHVLNDRRALDRLRDQRAKPVYPYGSGLEDEE